VRNALRRLLLATIMVGAWASGAGQVAEGQQAGRICLAPNPEEAMALDADTGNTEGYRSYEFAVRIDDGQWHDLPSGKPRWLPDVDLAGKHLAAIREGERVVESFWFTFQERGGPVLCLSYTPWYQTWLFEPPRSRPWCRCSE
jgi:hypothetical protein